MINNKIFLIFKINITYIIQSSCVFQIVRNELCKINAIVGFIFFSIGRGSFSLILLCKKNFHVRILKKIIKYGIKLENIEDDSSTNTFTNMFYKLFDKINNKNKKLKCCIYVCKIEILQELINFYIHKNNVDKNKINFNIDWNKYFEESSLKMLEKILIDISNKRAQKNYIVNDIDNNLEHMICYKRKKLGNIYMSFKEKINVLIIILVIICPIIVFIILFFLKYLQIQYI